MKASLLLIATLSLALGAFGQGTGGTSSGTSAGSGTPSAAKGTPAPASNNNAGAQAAAPGMTDASETSTTTGSSTGSDTGGYVYGGATASQPLLVTPVVHLGGVTPGVGATSSTAGNPVGATSFPDSANTPPVTIVPQMAMPEANAASGKPIAIGPPVADLGPASDNSAYQSASANDQDESVAQYAARFRSRNQNQAAHVYTNADVDRLNQQTGGVTGAAVNAGATPGAAPASNSSGMPVVSQPVGQPQAAPGVATPATPHTNPQPQGPFTPRQQAQGENTPTQQPAEMAQANPPAMPAAGQPSAAQAAHAPDDSAASGRTLPRSASPLPLMACLGLVAGAAGLYLRRS
jgi:hypothetical protein